MPRYYGEEPEIFAIKSSDGKITYLEMPRQAVEVQGLAMPPMEHRTARAPFQHGETYLGFSLTPRPIQVTMHMRGCNRYNMYEMRRDFIDLINPLVGKLRFRVSFRNGDIFELHNVVYDAGFDVGTNNQPEPTVQRFGARFIAYDPVWYKWPQNVDTSTLGSLSELVFPATFPIHFDTAGIETTITIPLQGNWLSFPELELTGPMNRPTITNLDTEEKLELSYKIPAGKSATISTQFGNKTVESSDGTNLLGYLTPDSDLATFHMDPDPIVDGGLNNIHLRATECTAASTFYIRWFDRVLGL
ncbi:hypothetical protein GF373_17720 [bacterium]|nr:hypothetical protein [bacterium]